MDLEKLKLLSEKAIVEYFEDIDSVVDKIVYKIIEDNGIKDGEIGESDMAFLRKKVMRGILKLD